MIEPIHIIETTEQANEFLKYLDTVPNIFGIDTETVGINPKVESPVGRGSIFCWSIAWFDARANLKDVRPGVPAACRAYLSRDVLPAFSAWLSNEDIKKVGHNVFTFDRSMFANHGIELRGIVGDTLRMSKLGYNHPAASHGLKDLGKLLGYSMDGYSKLFSRPARNKVDYKPEPDYPKHTRRKFGDRYVPTLVGTEIHTFSWSKTELIPLDELATHYPERVPILHKYASLDAKVTLELYVYLKAKLANATCSNKYPTMLDFYNEVWNPSLYVLNEMEQNGFDVDPTICLDGVRELERENETRRRLLTKTIQEWGLLRDGGADWNFNATQQRAELLYEKRNYPVPPICGSLKAVKRTRPGKNPTDAAALTWLAENLTGNDSWFCKELLAWRQADANITKLKKFPKYRDSLGRIHYQINPSTDTGRLSISNPPLQQVPKQGKIRYAFKASAGTKLIVADYSALEMRILAHFLVVAFGDHALAEDLLKEDFHQATADRLQISREFAKAVNYSVNYGKSAGGLSVQLGISKSEAEAILENYYEAYPAIRRWQILCESYCLKHGFVRTLLGRTRYVVEMSAEEWTSRYQEGYRKAINTPIQGSAADLVTMAMLRTNTKPLKELTKRGYYNARLDELGVVQVAQIHDELIFRVPVACADEALGIIKQEMEHPFDKDLTVQFPVNATICDSWAEGK